MCQSSNFTSTVFLGVAECAKVQNFTVFFGGFQVAAEVGGGAMRKSSTLICAPIMAETVANMVAEMGRAKAAGADLVEIRLDHLKVFDHTQDVKTIIDQSPLPTLFTYRYYYLLSYMIEVVFLWVCSSLSAYRDCGWLNWVDYK